MVRPTKNMVATNFLFVWFLTIWITVVLGAKDDDIRFLLNPGGSEQELEIDDASTLDGLPDYKGVKIFIHGFTSFCGKETSMAITNAYQKHKKDYATICVEWSPLSYKDDPNALINYPNAVTNTKTVGKRVAEFVNFLKDEGVIKDLASVHIIGFSLGAHVAGIAGNKLGGAVARITGLDPAGPLFDILKPLAERLDKSDAKFVDVIHTNAGKMGTNLVLGHRDYYPNGGSNQPKCNDPDTVEEVVNMVVGSCSHSAAPQYFAKSISNTKFGLACKYGSWDAFKKHKYTCKNKVLFGEGAKPGVTGKVYSKIG